MKFHNDRGGKSKQRLSMLGVTVLVIVAVLLVNVLASALCSANLIYTDVSNEFKYNVNTGSKIDVRYTSMYTLMGDTKTFLKGIFQSLEEAEAESGEEAAQVEIIFCAEPDLLKKNWQMRYVYYTALNLQKSFPKRIKVSTRDVWSNPSSVDEFRTNSYSAIYQSNVILSSGSEFRVFSLSAFYATDESTGSLYAYNGEKVLARGIVAVTRAESPICCLTTNHGEPFAGLDLNHSDQWEEYGAFIDVLESAGYEVRFLNLETDEIPENCRLIITLDPQTDFVSAYGNADVEVAETTKLDKFLANAYSYMVFVDADSPELPNMEEYLLEWGIAFERYSATDDAGNVTEGGYQIVDEKNALNQTGTSFVAQYATEGLGQSMTKDLQELGGSPKVIFENSTFFSFSPSYTTKLVAADADEGTDAYTYAYYEKNGVTRSVFDMFFSGAGSYTRVVRENAPLTDAEGAPVIADTSGSFGVVKVATESRVLGEGSGWTTVNDASYVCAVGSVDFAKDAFLQGNTYGNTDVLLSVLRGIGKEVVPVGLSMKKLYSDDISSSVLTQTSATVQTVLLTLAPALVLTVTGTVVLVKRKTKH